MTAASYKRSNMVIKVKKDSCKLKPKYGIKTSLELKNEIKFTQLQHNEKLISFEGYILIPSMSSWDVIKIELFLILWQNYCCNKGLILGNLFSLLL